METRSSNKALWLVLLLLAALTLVVVPSARAGFAEERRALRDQANDVRARHCRPDVHEFRHHASHFTVEQQPRVLAYWRAKLDRVRLERSWCRSAVPDWPWRALARCESGERWHYNGSSGYDGGLQFLPSTWTAAKAPVRIARRYAYAWQAPPFVQYRVARSWLARTSWHQWPHCARQLGLL